jgi:hypothetical protein
MTPWRKETPSERPNRSETHAANVTPVTDARRGAGMNPAGVAPLTNNQEEEMNEPTKIQKDFAVTRLDTAIRLIRSVHDLGFVCVGLVPAEDAVEVAKRTIMNLPTKETK